MSEIITVGLDLAKNVFQVHGADGAGRAVMRKKLRRAQVRAFFEELPPCVVAMEACGGAHYWGREIEKLGDEVRLIPPAYVKPFVKRQKNDAADAETICEAAMRPTPFADIWPSSDRPCLKGWPMRRNRLHSPKTRTSACLPPPFLFSGY